MFQVSLALIVALGAAVRIPNLSRVQLRSPDEHVYANRAIAVLEQGPFEGTRTAVEAHLLGKRWVSPPPTRVGYAWLVAASMALTGARDERAGSYVSLIASLLTLVVAAGIGLHFFDEWVALFG